jgi:hypothetical protein
VTPGTRLAEILAAAEPATTGGLDLTQIFTFAQFGLLGIFFVMLVSKKFVVPKWTLDDLKEAHDRELAVKDSIIDSHKADIVELKKTVADLQNLTSEKMIPALVQANTLSAAYVSELARRGGGGGITP